MDETSVRSVLFSHSSFLSHCKCSCKVASSILNYNPSAQGARNIRVQQPSTGSPKTGGSSGGDCEHVVDLKLECFGFCRL